MRSSTTLEGEIVIPDNIIEGFFGGSGAVSPMKAMAQGRTLRRFLYEPDLWQILGYGTRGGWLDGGCAILADALHEVLGPAAQRIMLTDVRGVPQHIAVIYRGMVVDGDGVSTQRAFLQRWLTVEGVDGASIALFDSTRLGDIPRDQGASTDLAAQLRRFAGLESGRHPHLLGWDEFPARSIAKP
jgi:hypothetical protein